MTAQGPAQELDIARAAPDGGGATTLYPAAIDAVLFDLDGVITDTARLHARAWKRAFDQYLREREATAGGRYRPFDAIRDYRLYVDGKPRYDGVASFLDSRGIVLPRGRPGDPPEAETVCGLGNRKNRIFGELLRRDGVEVYGGAVDLLRRLRVRGVKTALVSSSRNTTAIVEAAGVASLFDCVVDGIVAAQWHLKGKPAPDSFLEAARRLAVDPPRAAIVEDAISGVAAGRAGEFAMVIGVAHGGTEQDLRQAGADVVVRDLSELRLGDGAAAVAVPSALGSMHEIRARIGSRRIAVFLDYDGTLTPIVARPELAVLSDDMRAVLAELAQGAAAVAIISGRARSNVEALVGLPQLVYAGSHGFDIAAPHADLPGHHVGDDVVPALQQALVVLHERLDSVEGVIIEDKDYSLSVHYRLVAPDQVPAVRAVVEAVAAEHPNLRQTGGKKVFELRPAIDWDKGKALLWLLEALGLEGPEVLPFYFGDDETDEDAFAVLRNRGIGVLVSTQAQETQAHYRLDSPDEVGAFLRELSAQMKERSA